MSQNATDVHDTAVDQGLKVSPGASGICNIIKLGTSVPRKRFSSSAFAAEKVYSCCALHKMFLMSGICFYLFHRPPAGPLFIFGRPGKLGHLQDGPGALAGATRRSASMHLIGNSLREVVGLQRSLPESGQQVFDFLTCALSRATA